MKFLRELIDAMWFVANVLWFGIRVKRVGIRQKRLDARQDKIDREWYNIQTYAQKCKKKWSYFEEEVLKFYSPKKPL